jgi:hypothetical protein
MLADTTEAVTKSKRPNSAEELEEVVDRAIKLRTDQGQLDDCNLTLRDLQVIRKSFVDTLKGQYHTRIEYPEPAPSETAIQESPPDAIPSAESSSVPFETAFGPSLEREEEAHESVGNPD